MSLDSELDVTVDDAVEFALTVTNTGDEPATLDFRSGLTADFAVVDGDEDVWRWSDGRMFTQALQTETLAPGENVVYTATWAEPVPGSYVTVARLEATNADVESRAEFDV